jgi:hypothetical protein
MEDFNSDLVLHVVQFLNVIDSGRFAQASKRYHYLVHQYRLLSGPDLATSSSWDICTLTLMISQGAIATSAIASAPAAESI